MKDTTEFLWRIQWMNECYKINDLMALYIIIILIHLLIWEIFIFIINK